MKKINVILLAFSLLFMYSCGSDSSKTDKKVEEVKKEVAEKVEEVKEEVKEEANANSIGVGPISKVELGAIDEAMVEKGKEIFKTNCTACHKMGKRKIGPALDGVTTRRTPEWIMNMIMNPDEMVQKDPIAMALLAEYSAPMSNQSINEEDARAILEFFRSRETK